MNKSYWIETLGCPKNQVDSRSMDSSFQKEGFSRAVSAQRADFIIINSCSFIQEAQEETIQTIFDSLQLKEKNGNRVVLVGCFAERFARQTQKEIPELDGIIGVGKFDRVAGILKEQFALQNAPPENAYNAILSQNEESGEKNPQGKPSSTDKPYAYFRIAQGCSRKCSFCAIPNIRGDLKPYSLNQLKQQLDQELALRNKTPLREVILVSQDTISQDMTELEKAIDFFSKIKDVHWIRLHYLFPDKRVLKLLDLFDKYPKLVSYLDIPFQHISPRVLKRMNRPYDIALFRDILTKWRDVRRAGEVRTSFILGFPGETQADTDQIQEFLSSHPIEKLSLFRYSHEASTPSYQSYTDDIPDEIKIERLNQIRAFHLTTREERRMKLLGSQESVLIESVDSTTLLCRRQQDSPEIDEMVHVPIPSDLHGSQLPQTGEFVLVELESALEYDWTGKLLKR